MTQQDNPSIRHKKYSVEWYTPADLLAPLVKVVTATLTAEDRQRLVRGDHGPQPWGDPCTSPAALAYQAAQGIHAPSWHLAEGALEAEWDALPLFVNPPFGRGMGRWVERCATHRRPVILLTPASTEVQWWQDAYRQARAAVFLRKRVAFLDKDLVPQKENPKGTTLFLFSPYVFKHEPMIDFKAWAKQAGHLYQEVEL